MKKETLFTAAVLVILGLLGILSFNHNPGAKPENVRIASGGESGVYFKYGGALADVIGKKTNINVIVLSSGGSVENIRLLRDDRAELAFVQNDIMTYAYNGTDIFSTEGPFKNFSAVAGLYPEVCQIVAKEGIEDISALKGRRVSVGAEGSGTELNALQILESYGMSETDILVEHLGFGASVQALKEGKIDAFFCTAGVPTPAISELAASGGITILSIGEAHARYLINSFPYYSREIIAIDAYPGIGEEITTVAVRATLVASNRMSAEDVYTITKLLFEEKAGIASICEEADDLDRRKAIEGIPIPLHEGAEKFLISEK